MSKVFTGAGRVFQEVQSLPLDDESLAEIEQRIKLQPHFLGEPLVVFAETADFPQILPGSSHDLIGLDAKGQTVVISLANGVADTESHLRGLPLLAHLATLNIDDLGKIARSFLNRAANDSLRRAWEDMGVEMSDESIELSSLLASTFERDAEDYSDLINHGQRLIVASEAFSSRLVGVIDWMVGCGVGIVGLRYKKYLVGGQEVYFAEQVVPRVDPAIDALDHVAGKAGGDAAEPWRTKGRAYHLERLTPATGNLLDQLLMMMRPNTFTVNWSHKYYFWIRGPKRNLRIRTYFRDHIEIGFYNAAPAAVEEFLEAYGIQSEVQVVGGYADSPFLSVAPEINLDESWEQMLNGWLSGADGPGSKPTVRIDPIT